MLESFEAGAKPKIIREVKALVPNLTLIDAKKFVESLPKVLKENQSKEDADKMKATFEATGCKIRLKSEYLTIVRIRYRCIQRRKKNDRKQEDSVFGEIAILESKIALLSLTPRTFPVEVHVHPLLVFLCDGLRLRMPLEPC